MEFFYDILKHLDHEIDQENQRRRKEGDFGLPRTEIKILGQMSLISNPEVSAQINLFSTFDVDALIEGHYWVKTEFEKLLKNNALELDPLSDEIWIPSESTFSEFFLSVRLICSRLDPVYALASKAIKAKEKNKLLIAQALDVYGDDLKKLIKKYGGDIRYFELKNGTEKK